MGREAQSNPHASATLLTTDSLGRYRCLGRLPAIAVVQTAQDRMGHNPTAGVQELNRDKSGKLVAWLCRWGLQATILPQNEPTGHGSRTDVRFRPAQVAKGACRLAARMPFQAAAEDYQALTGTAISAKSVERLAHA